MTAIPGSQAAIYLGGYDLSYFLRGASVDRSRDMVDSTTYRSALQPAGAVWKEFIAALMTGTASLEGNFEGDLKQSDERLEAAFAASDSIVSIALQDVLGGVGFGFLANETAYKISEPVEGLVSVTAAFQADGIIDRVLVNHPGIVPETGAANGGVIDNGAASANGLVAYLHAIAFTGTDCTIKVQSSANNSTWADLLTFTVVTGANVAERLAVAGSIARYTRWIISGTFASITFQLSIGRK